MYIPIILICAKGVIACHLDNASDKIPLEPTNTPMACISAGQTKIATLAIAPKEGETYTIVCKVNR